MMVPAEAYQLSHYARQVGADDPLPYVEDLAKVGLETLRTVGATVWGDHAEPGPFRVEMEEEAALLLEKLHKDVHPEWSGEQYQAFEHHMRTLTSRMDERAREFSVIGATLVEIAQEFEFAWYEVVGLIVSALGLVVSAVGVVIAITTGWTGVGAIAGVITALVGLIISAVGLAITHVSAVQPRLAAAAEALERMNEITVRSGDVI